MHDEDLLMAVLNSSPVVDGVRTDQLDGEVGRALCARFGGSGEPGEVDHLRRVRAALHGLIHEQPGCVRDLQVLLAGTSWQPVVVAEGIEWVLRAPADHRLGARAAAAWARASADLPGRLRPCANTECNLFLLDHSRPGTARWCAMATCGNRMKARAHAHRRRGVGDT